MSRVFIPDTLNLVFNPETMLDLHRFLQKTDEKMMFIYGENDPWTASGAKVPKKENLVKMVLKGGSHRTRINSFPEEQKAKMIETLKNWISSP